MPVAFFLIGALFLTAAVRGQQDLLFATLKDDFTGPRNFFFWALAIFLIAMLGNYKPLRPVSNAFMVLVFLVLFISNRGFFNKFMAQIGATQHAPLRNAVVGEWEPEKPSDAYREALGALSDLSTSFFGRK